MDRRRLLSLSAVAATAAVAAACAPESGPTPAGDDSPAASEPFRYSPPGYEGLSIELDKPATRIVADIYSAAALQPYGIEPVGIFGYGRDGAGKGDLDIDSMNIIGLDAEFSLEKLAAAEPDIVLGYGNTDGSGWTWWDEKLIPQVSAVAPYVPVKFSYLPKEMISHYRDLALLLGGTESAELVQQEKDYDAVVERISAAAEEKKDWLTVLPAQFGTDAIWTSFTLGQIKMLSETGLSFVGPEQNGESAWAEVSWEKIGEYEADLLLLHETSLDYEDNPVYKNLPAVKAGQIGTWDDKRAYTWSGYTSWLTSVAEVVEQAEDIVD